MESQLPETLKVIPSQPLNSLDLPLYSMTQVGLLNSTMFSGLD